MSVVAIDSRQQLRRLILDGLKGRSLKQLFEQLVKRFNERGEQLSAECFKMWVEGRSFPANRHRQAILAEVVGGPCGEAIKVLPGPAFRGWRRRVMKETDQMSQGLSSKNMKHRQYPMVPRRVGDDGRTALHARITCAGCGKYYHHLRRGMLDSDEYFRKKGWEVGNNAEHDYCPECIERRKKVVKMEDHVKKPAEPPAEPVAATMGREDGRLLSRLIEDHWDENLGRYQPGWSDQKLAEHAGKPVDWVKAIRERDFGGAGEDPTLVEFVAEAVTLRGEQDALHRHLAELESAIGEFNVAHTKVRELLDRYRDRHNALAKKVTRLNDMAEKLPPPFKGEAA